MATREENLDYLETVVEDLEEDRRYTAVEIVERVGNGPIHESVVGNYMSRLAGAAPGAVDVDRGEPNTYTVRDRDGARKGVEDLREGNGKSLEEARDIVARELDGQEADAEDIASILARKGIGRNFRRRMYFAHEIEGDSGGGEA